MRTPSFFDPPGGKAWLVTPAAQPALQWVSEPVWPVFHPEDRHADLEAFPDRLFRWEGLAAPPSDNAEPYSLQWFLAVEHQRHARQARWIPQLLEFARHGGDTLLGLGSGLGTDWLQYARHGAKVIACSPRSAELFLIRRNFELRGLSARFVHAEPLALPLSDASIDVVCLSWLIHEVAEPELVVSEVYRVLKPGGKVLAVVPARYHVDYWRRWAFPWSSWIPSGGPNSPWHSGDRDRSKIPEYSGRRLKKLFGDFVDHRVHKRQLARREIPWVWRWLPRTWLERLLGRMLILKAFKPLSVSMQRRAAA